MGNALADRIHRTFNFGWLKIEGRDAAIIHFLHLFFQELANERISSPSSNHIENYHRETTTARFEVFPNCDFGVFVSEQSDIDASVAESLCDVPADSLTMPSVCEFNLDHVFPKEIIAFQVGLQEIAQLLEFLLFRTNENDYLIINGCRWRWSRQLDGASKSSLLA